VLILKAFSAGCSSLTGVEAIANAVPQFRTPIVERAQHTEVALGVLLAAMLLGLAALIRLHQVTPRGDVTVLAQLSAGAFGTGWPFYVTNLAVTLVLALAANTSFGGLPVLMQLLAKDHRLPHLFTLRAERPVYRYGVAALGVLAAAVLLLVGAETHRLLPVFAIGVFIGFTISQTGLVRHWLQQRGRGWVGKAALNGTGAVLTAVAGVVLFASKFTEGAWLLLLVPGLMLLFARIERYYYHVAEQLDLGRPPPKPVPGPSGKAGDALVIVPVVTISKVVARALQAAMWVGGEVVPVAVDTDPGVDLRVLPSPHRTLVAPAVGFVRTQVEKGRFVIVLLAYIEPRRRRYRILHNQRGPLLATTIRGRTDAIVATLPIRLD
jgi:amino acid transporter